MIQRDMKAHNVFGFGPPDDYGQRVPNVSLGTILVSIQEINTSIVGGIDYKDSTYMGLTQNPQIVEATVIDYNGKKLKTQNVIRAGRFFQVFLKEM